MKLTPTRPEIDHRTIKLLIGAVALSLAPLTAVASAGHITSISESYHVGGWSQSIFVGYLFAIASLLVAHNGRSSREMILSKVASVAALGVALFPCGCGVPGRGSTMAHWIAAGAMFLVLAQFCREFRHRARQKGYAQAEVRATVYAVCGWTILAAIAALVLDGALGDALSRKVRGFTFYGEAVALSAFGTSWLVASRVIPGITRSDERFSPLRDVNPA